jgi:small subunit ribosomal protein S9
MNEDDRREPEQQDADPAAEQAAGGDEERNSEEQPETPAEQPEAEGSEQSNGAEGEREAATEAPESTEGEEGPDTDVPAVSEEAPPESEPSEEVEAEGETSEERKSELPPGAELEPITIEPQRELSAEERARLEAEAEERARAEAEATAETGEEPVPAREPAVELPSDARIQATGKRKTSIARVVLRAGSGEFEINRRALEEYFPRHQHQTLVRQPLLTSGYEGKVDVRVRVHGGGISGQAGAVRHGIARALTAVDPELRGELKRRGLLTRDARAKERRKAGLKKARKRPQFSKR